jgi:hypothetical protein
MLINKTTGVLFRRLKQTVYDSRLQREDHFRTFAVIADDFDRHACRSAFSRYRNRRPDSAFFTMVETARTSRRGFAASGGDDVPYLQDIIAVIREFEFILGRYTLRDDTEVMNFNGEFDRGLCASQGCN